MNCLKCGREIPEDEVFCADCLLDGQRYPVDPSTAVYLPKREVTEAPKKPIRRRVVTAEEQLKTARKRLRNVTALALLLLALAASMVYPTYRYLTKVQHRTGQNYSSKTIVPSTSAPPPAANP